MPVLTDSPADEPMRRIWTERLFQAVQDDGVDYLSVVKDHWAEICRYPGLINQWANDTLPTPQRVWPNTDSYAYFAGDIICLACLLEARRYKDLKDILSLQKRHKIWSYNQYWAMALLKQGKLREAIQYAEQMISSNGSSSATSIWWFCEDALIDAGLVDEAYERYGLLSLPANSSRPDQEFR